MPINGPQLNDSLGSAWYAMRQMRALDADIRLQAQQKAAAKGLDATVMVSIDYTIGPDGQLYAAGGTVSTSRRSQGPEVAPANAPLVQWRARPTSLAQLQSPAPVMDSASFASLWESQQLPDLSVSRRLAAMDASVRSHERQHFFAAGGLVEGIPVYDLVQGPDGQYYAAGGAVQVSVGGGTPEDQARDAAALARAATGPADSSAADVGAAQGFLKVAAGRYREASQLTPQNDNHPRYSVAA
jgi:hypothetical protein